MLSTFQLHHLNSQSLYEIVFLKLPSFCVMHLKKGFKFHIWLRHSFQLQSSEDYQRLTAHRGSSSPSGPLENRAVVRRLRSVPAADMKTYGKTEALVIWCNWAVTFRARSLYPLRTWPRDASSPEPLSERYRKGRILALYEIEPRSSLDRA
jgi:hypothetical protein